MKKVNLYKKEIINRRQISTFKKKVKRKQLKKRLKSGFEKYMNDVRKLHPKERKSKESFYQHRQKSKLQPKPKLSDGLKYFLKNQKCFCQRKVGI